MIAAALVLALQAGLPTVGDTVWVERAVTAQANVLIRPQAWDLGTAGRQLAPAEVRRGVLGTVIRYALVFWHPGRHTLRMPGPVVISREGTSDTLVASTVVIDVASVLPEGTPRERIAPKPARPPLALAARSPRPLLIGVPLVAIAVTLLALRRRRRGAPVPERKANIARPDPGTLAQWAGGGEYHAALDQWEHRLALTLRQAGDLDRMARVQQVLEEIALAAYEPRAAGRLAELCARAAETDGGRAR